VTKKEALKHPNWDMGAKVTIDSASLMNKGLEMIEAKWLFDVSPDQIEVVVHPQSVIHSMVQFEDSSIIAQLGLPDMHLPIQYALGYPARLKSNFERLDFFKLKTMTFEKPDIQRFRNLSFAFEAAKTKGNMPCTMNAANEIAVAAFLQDRIGFLEMSDVIERTMQKTAFVKVPAYDDYVQTDIEARSIALEFIK
jgi:1-deoxy-D-xylulose-5-phosphate reductoisomerase